MEIKVVHLRPADNLNALCVFVGKTTYNVEVKKTKFLGFVFRKVVQNHYIGEVGKQRTV